MGVSTGNRITTVLTASMMGAINKLEALSAFPVTAVTLDSSDVSGTDPVVTLVHKPIIANVGDVILYAMKKTSVPISGSTVVSDVVFSCTSILTSPTELYVSEDEFSITNLNHNINFGNMDDFSLLGEISGDTYYRVISSVLGTVTSSANIGSGSHAYLWVTSVDKSFITIRDYLVSPDVVYYSKTGSVKQTIVSEGDVVDGTAIAITALGFLENDELIITSGQGDTIRILLYTRSFDEYSFSRELNLVDLTATDDISFFTRVVNRIIPDQGPPSGLPEERGWPGMITLSNGLINPGNGFIASMQSYRYDKDDGVAGDIRDGVIERSNDALFPLRDMVALRETLSFNLIIASVNGLESRPRVHYNQTEWTKYRDHVTGSDKSLGFGDAGQTLPLYSEFQYKRIDAQELLDMQAALVALAPSYSPTIHPNIVPYTLTTDSANIFLHTFGDRYDWNYTPAEDGRYFADSINEIQDVRAKIASSNEITDESEIPI